MVVADYHVIEMQDRLGQSLTGNCWGRQSLQCPVQIISKKAGRATLKWGNIGAMLLWIRREKGTKSFPWIAFESFSAATRLSFGNHVGAERVAGHV